MNWDATGPGRENPQPHNQSVVFRHLVPLRAWGSVWRDASFRNILPLRVSCSFVISRPCVHEIPFGHTALPNPPRLYELHALTKWFCKYGPNGTPYTQGHTITERITPQGPEMTCSARVETQNFASLQHSPIVILCNKNGRDHRPRPFILNFLIFYYLPVRHCFDEIDAGGVMGEVDLRGLYGGTVWVRP